MVILNNSVFYNDLLQFLRFLFCFQARNIRNKPVINRDIQSIRFEEMQSEISRLTRSNLVKFDNDATSCYDRIIVLLASLASRKYGMHKHVALVNV